MTFKDASFLPDAGLDHALDLLRRFSPDPKTIPSPLSDPGIGDSEIGDLEIGDLEIGEVGIGEVATLDRLALHVLGDAARLDAPHALAHMDPPTPWITWAITLWNARLNQNMLHRATAPFALEAEQRVIDWLLPFFGMKGGHFCSGSTLANLTALWAARDGGGVKKIVASEVAHISIEKSARILGLPLVKVPIDPQGQLAPQHLPNLTDACLVLTAGTTATGSIDPLQLAGQARWTHVDAAWAGPLRFSSTYAPLLDGIEQAESITISAHKWLFQPKESAFVLFRNLELAQGAISFGSGYLATPNVGVQGSRGAAAIPLLATLMAWGRKGLVERIDRTMAMAQQFATQLQQLEQFSLWAMPTTGITVFRPTQTTTEAIYARLPEGMLSTCILGQERWLRSVAANPLADIDEIILSLQNSGLE
jgi:glutamate/tyrosine decarboxylase-like PLP-dependent enzyme